MRVFAAAALIAAATAACGGSPFRQYEYEEDIYLSLDGAATVYVNSSVAALDALRGAAFDTRPSATIDRERVRAFFSTPLTRPARITTSRRSGRRFVHVGRADTHDSGEYATGQLLHRNSCRLLQRCLRIGRRQQLCEHGHHRAVGMRIGSRGELGHSDGYASDSGAWRHGDAVGMDGEESGDGIDGHERLQ